MPTNIPINLQLKVTKILRIISLYPVMPTFQNKFDFAGYPVFPTPEQYVRDTSVISFGFPHSRDTIFTLIDPPEVFSIPQNAYTFVQPSFLDNQNSSDLYSVLLIDVDSANIEPGFSRLRIDYINSKNQQTVEYLDMPFYPAWDNHPSSLQAISDYSEEAIGFLQEEIYKNQTDILHVLNRMQTKGFHVSGQVYSTKSNSTQPYTPLQSHNFEPNQYLNQKFIEAKSNEIKTKTIETKDIVGYSIISHPAAVYIDDTFMVSMSENIHQGEVLCLNNYPLETNIVDNSFYAKLPLAANLNYEFQLSVQKNGIKQAPEVDLIVKAKPFVSKIITNSGNQFVKANEEIEIQGFNFGESGIINFNNVVIDSTLWSDFSIKFIMPNGLASGQGYITSEDGKIAHFSLSVEDSNQNNIFNILPEVNTVNFGQSLNYQAYLNGNIVDVNWSLESNNGNIGSGEVNFGYIDSQGIYTAPSIVSESFNIAVVANYNDGKNNYYDKSSLLIAENNNTFTISPSSTILEPSFTQLFNIQYNGVDVTDKCQYYINGIMNGNNEFGVINENGLYVAPTTVPTNQTIHLDAVYNNQTTSVLIRIVKVGSILEPVAKNANLETLLDSKSGPDYTSILYYRSIAYANMSSTNSYHTTAPGILTPKVGYNDTYFSGLTTADDPNSEQYTMPKMYVYMGQAKDAAGKSCVVLLIGQDKNYTASSFSSNSGSTAAIKLFTTGGALSKFARANNYGLQFIRTETGNPTISSIDDMAKTSTEMDIDLTESNRMLSLGNPFQEYNINDYYYSKRGFILRGYPTMVGLGSRQTGGPYTDSAFDQGEFAVIDALYDLVQTEPGVEFFRVIMYPENSTLKIGVSFVHSFFVTKARNSGFINYPGTITGSQIASSKFSSGGVITLQQPTPPVPPASPPQPLPPAPSLNSSTSACLGKNITLVGQNFTADIQAYMNNNLLMPRTGPPSTSDGVNFSLTVTVPNSVSQNAANYNVYVKGNTGTSNTIGFSVPNNCVIYPITLTVSPLNSSLKINTGQKFSASLQKEDGTHVDVTNSVNWYVANIQGGNSQNGFIDNTGFYFAPASVPTNNPVEVKATYSYNNQPVQGTSAVTIIPLYIGNPPPPPPSITSGCYMLRVSPEITTVNVPGNPVQFTAQLYINNSNPQDVYATWFINGIPGGNNSLGHIDPNGLYTPPAFYPPADTPFIKVEAHYTTTPKPPDTSPIDLIGYSVVGFSRTETQSGICQVTVVEQINVFFGDGRNGYIPAGTTISMMPGEYLLATYNEKIDTFLLPYNDNSGSQMLSLYTHSAKANDLSRVLYNEGTLTKISGNNIILNPNTIYSKPYTVVLGICDPNIGKLQSMWDILPVIFDSGNNSDIPIQPTACIVSHNMELKEEEKVFEPKITDIIEEKIKPIQIITKNKFESFWVGSFILKNKKIEIENKNLFI